ncbi:hypothetical protein F183_A05020 [Bryobacterales bacterium F-183]|nr:hypothetical protein F183_A05020 [Bryobacterales bacterium F-183]
MRGADEFIRFLKDHGLHAAASSETTADLHHKYGDRSWYGFSTVIDLPPAALFPEQAGQPFYVHLEPRRYLIPPDRFTCDFNPYRNGEKNHRTALARLEAIFGQPQKGVASNTREHNWHFGDGGPSLTIRTFLKEKSQFGRNDLYANNPELWEVCSITIERPWVGELTAEEEALIAAVPPADLFLVPQIGAQPYGGGYVRRHKLRQPPSAYLWRTKGHLGWCNRGGAAVFERSAVARLDLLQVLPARGGGGAYLSLRFQNPHSLEREVVGTEILANGATHGLDELAKRVAKFWGLPLTVSETHDC